MQPTSEPAPAADEHGVDLTLIDEMLCLSPEARLRLNDQTIATIHELRSAFATDRPDHIAHQAGERGR